MAKVLLLQVVLLAAIAAAAASSFSSEEYSSEESLESLELAEEEKLTNGFELKYFDQCMDHFDPSDPSPDCQNTWKEVK